MTNQTALQEVIWGILEDTQDYDTAAYQIFHHAKKLVGVVDNAEGAPWLDSTEVESFIELASIIEALSAKAKKMV